MSIPAGTVYAHLTVLKEAERSGLNRRFLCRCVCGKETVKFLNNLRTGRSTSCGCTYTMGLVGRTVVLTQRRERANVTADGRACLTCGEWKPWSEFASDKRRANNKASNCMECGRWRSVKAQLGITRAEWLWLAQQQGNVCYLCGEVKDDRKLCVDHDHACCPDGRACKQCIRGLLCDTCNRLIGLAETRQLVADRFADYLSRRPFRSVSAPSTQAVLE